MKCEGMWCLVLKDGREFPFYHGTKAQNPIKEIEGFDQGEYYSVDIEDINNEFPKDEKGFSLVPKKLVKDIVFRRYGTRTIDGRVIKKPKKIRLMSLDELIMEKIIKNSNT